MTANSSAPLSTNQERSTRTKEKLLQATLDCLSEDGYAAMTTGQVVDRAGVSRGALLHHYPSKSDLVAEAAVFLIKKRSEYAFQELSKNKDQLSSVHDRLQMEWKIYEKWFPANIEFMVAARTNKKLRDHFSEAANLYTAKLKDDKISDFLKFRGPSEDEDLYPVVGCFLRGLSLVGILNTDEQNQKILDQFSDILEFYIENKNQ